MFDELSDMATNDEGYAPFQPHHLLLQHLRNIDSGSSGHHLDELRAGLTFNGLHSVYPRVSLCS